MCGLRLASRCCSDRGAQRLGRLLRLLSQRCEAAVQVLPVPLRVSCRLACLRCRALRRFEGAELGLRCCHRVQGRAAQLLEVGGGTRHHGAGAAATAASGRRPPVASRLLAPCPVAPLAGRAGAGQGLQGVPATRRLRRQHPSAAPQTLGSTMQARWTAWQGPTRCAKHLTWRARCLVGALAAKNRRWRFVGEQWNLPMQLPVL